MKHGSENNGKEKPLAEAPEDAVRCQQSTYIPFKNMPITKLPNVVAHL